MRELVADLVEVLPIVLAPEAESMLAMYPRHFINELQGVIVVGERTVVGVADPAESPPLNTTLGIPHVIGAPGF